MCVAGTNVTFVHVARAKPPAFGDMVRSGEGMEGGGGYTAAMLLCVELRVWRLGGETCPLLLTLARAGSAVA